MADEPLTAAQKVFYSVSLFIEAYKTLSPSGRAIFEAQITDTAKKQDERTSRLYEMLLNGARAGLSSSTIISKMEDADRALAKSNG